MIDRQLLHNTLTIQSSSGKTERMVSYITRFAKRMGGVKVVVNDGNIYLTKGYADVYPCVIAHTDTVHRIIDDFIVNARDGVFTAKDRKTGDQVGVGGDDKAGIAIALQALRDHDTIKVAFFRDEEIGCKGSGRADMTFFENCAFVIECDRRGNADVVRSIYGTRLYDDTFAEAMKPYLAKHKFQETTGMLTDVYALRKLGLEIASFNMSAGYYEPHTPRETVRLDDINKTYGFVVDIIENLGEQQWVCPYEISSQFSLFEGDEEEEEESEYDDDDIIYVGQRVMANTYVDTCPDCGESNLDYDDTVGAWFCMVCFDYVYIDEELEVS